MTVHIAIRLPDNRLKVLEYPDADAARAGMVEYYATNPALHFFRVIPQGKDVLLRRLKPSAGTVVTEPRVVDAEFEDDV